MNCINCNIKINHPKTKYCSYLCGKRKRYYLNQSKILEQSRKDYQKNKEKLKKRSRLYYHLHKDECYARNREWRRNNIERVRARDRAWARINRPKKNNWHKKFVMNNKWKVALYNKKYRATNRESESAKSRERSILRSLFNTSVVSIEIKKLIAFKRMVRLLYDGKINGKDFFRIKNLIENGLTTTPYSGEYVYAKHRH